MTDTSGAPVLIFAPSERYSSCVVETSTAGGSSPTFRRRSAAFLPRFFCARIAFLWGRCAGEPKGSPDPKPGLLTLRTDPALTFSSVARGGLTA